jgi:Flp pilus assembly pilin Flp
MTSKRIWADVRGAVMAEYVILVGVVGLVVVAAFLLAGPQIVALYQKVRNALASPLP